MVTLPGISGATTIANLVPNSPPQLKWAPDETGGELISEFVLQMQPAPQQWEGPPTPEVCCGVLQAACSCVVMRFCCCKFQQA